MVRSPLCGRLKAVGTSGREPRGTLDTSLLFPLDIGIESSVASFEPAVELRVCFGSDLTAGLEEGGGLKLSRCRVKSGREALGVEDVRVDLEAKLCRESEEW